MVKDSTAPRPGSTSCLCILATQFIGITDFFSVQLVLLAFQIFILEKLLDIEVELSLLLQQLPVCKISVFDEIGGGGDKADLAAVTVHSVGEILSPGQGI